jgi:hypothetical protein
MIPPVTLHYLARIPGGALPAGMCLVHNSVRPQPRLGDKGFRAWTQPLSRDLEVCHCDWAGVDLHGLVHYRVKCKG